MRRYRGTFLSKAPQLQADVKPHLDLSDRTRRDCCAVPPQSKSARVQHQIVRASIARNAISTSSAPPPPPLLLRRTRGMRAMWPSTRKFLRRKCSRHAIAYMGQQHLRHKSTSPPNGTKNTHTHKSLKILLTRLRSIILTSRAKNRRPLQMSLATKPAIGGYICARKSHFLSVGERARPRALGNAPNGLGAVVDGAGQCKIDKGASASAAERERAVVVVRRRHHRVNTHTNGGGGGGVADKGARR